MATVFNILAILVMVAVVVVLIRGLAKSQETLGTQP